MSRKSQGINAERELVHLFWKEGWGAIRVAGSGSSRYPSPDIVAGKLGRILVIECKSGSEASRYISKQDIDDLLQFANFLNAEAWIGVRIRRQKWIFLSPSELHSTGINYVVNAKTILLKGLSFEEISA